MFGGIYQGKKVLITGSTGFKGSYLAVFLNLLGAECCGIGLPMPEKSHFDLCGAGKFCPTVYCDIRNREKLNKIIRDFQPEILFHLAAQSLVRKSYYDPLETYSTNVMGTANILECCRNCDSLRAVVVISSDKCYQNREISVPYREEDPLGGYDPYSASKGCTEIVTASYRQSFFSPENYGHTHQVLLGSCRAGNVIGGGDYACDRLVPDLVRGALAGKETVLRNPFSVRPWQHVWEPLAGYLLLGEKLLRGEISFAESWNFGPESGNLVRVLDAACLLQKYWDKIKIRTDESCHEKERALHEAGLLLLDSSKARRILQWESVWNMEKTFKAAAQWYRRYHEEGVILSEEQLEEYIEDAVKANVQWSIR